MSTREPGPGRIDIRVPTAGLLFDALDPAIHQDKDLSPKIDEYIAESAIELPGRGPYALTVYLDQPPGGDQERLVGEAIRAHFTRRARNLGRKLRRLLRRGLVSLGIGLAFLLTILLLERLAGRAHPDALGTLFRQSLVIVGWVAMWRPLEIFLYDWWPIVGERRLYERLSRITVRVVPASG